MEIEEDSKAHVGIPNYLPLGSKSNEVKDGCTNGLERAPTRPTLV